MSTEQLKSTWAALDAIPDANPLSGELPVVELPFNGVTFTRTAQKLFPLMAATGTYFVRGGRPVRLCSREDGAQFLSILRADEARSSFEKVATLVAMRKGANNEWVWKPSTCSADAADALLATDEAKRLLPEVTSLVNCPLIYEKTGELHVAKPGYDEVRKILITGGAAPEQVEIKTAVSALLLPFA